MVTGMAVMATVFTMSWTSAQRVIPTVDNHCGQAFDLRVSRR